MSTTVRCSRVRHVWRRPFVALALSGCAEASFTAGDAATGDSFQLPAEPPPDGSFQLIIEEAAPPVPPLASCPVDDDAGAVEAAAPHTTPITDSGLSPPDADAAPTSIDASACPLAPGSLVMDEVMTATVSGSDDRGQWVEVRSTAACTLDLLGLHASAPHGSSFHTMDVLTDVPLPPGGFFLIADSLDAGVNGDLPGLVFAWAGSPADAIHKTSDTITLSVSGTTIASLSYPDKMRTIGTSMAFPADCPIALLPDYADWQPSVASWTPGFFGTPGAPNTDVHCTVPLPAASATSASATTSSAPPSGGCSSSAARRRRR